MQYRLYCFDERGARLPAETIDALNDTHAIELAREKDRQRGELWESTRLVWKLPD